MDINLVAVLGDGAKTEELVVEWSMTMIDHEALIQRKNYSQQGPNG